MQKGVYAYHGFRDYERARTEFGLARRTLPNDAKLYLYLGSVDRRQGRWEDAVRDFNRATELDPRNAVILQEAGFTFIALRRYAEATSLTERAFALGSKNVFVRAILWQLPYFARADTGPWRSHLNAILDEGKEAASHAAFAFVDCALAERDRQMAAQALTIIPAEGAQNWPNNSLGHAIGMSGWWHAALAIATERKARSPQPGTLCQDGTRPAGIRTSLESGRDDRRRPWAQNRGDHRG